VIVYQRFHIPLISKISGPVASKRFPGGIFINYRPKEGISGALVFKGLSGYGREMERL
jgi:hypothetical protein